MPVISTACPYLQGALGGGGDVLVVITEHTDAPTTIDEVNCDYFRPQDEKGPCTRPGKCSDDNPNCWYSGGFKKLEPEEE
tara:strand:+ start:484 stop:723 length:240 start_codon:yes stop_codon:yes gene_type:complete